MPQFFNVILCAAVVLCTCVFAIVVSFAMLPRSMFAVPAVFCNTKLYLPRLIGFYYDIIGTNLGPDVSCGCLSSCTKGSVCLPCWGRLDLRPSTKWEDAHRGIPQKGEWPGHTKFWSKRRCQTNGNNATEGLQKSSHVRWDPIYVFKDLGRGLTLGVIQWGYTEGGALHYSWGLRI